MTTKIWDDVFTGLDLNGPKLSIVTDTFSHVEDDESTAQSHVCASGPRTGEGRRTIAFTGLATATFPAGSNPSFDGTVEYQWYKIALDGTETKLGPSTTYNGETTSNLVLFYVDSPAQNGERYFFEADYKPRAYGEVGSGKSTPNAINEPLRSTPATLNVKPTLEITAGVSTSIVTADNQTSFSVVASMDRGTNPSADSQIQYQWCLDGDCNITDGVRETQSVANQIVKEFSYTGGTQSLVIPDDATNVRIKVEAGAGGPGGSDSNGVGGNGGLGRYGTFSLADGGRTLTIDIGNRGGSGGSSRKGDGGGTAGTGGPKGAGRGGHAGTSGSSGAGGGGADGIYIQDSISGTYIIAAGGGAGGGGGSLNRNCITDGTADGKVFQSIDGGLSGFNGPFDGEDRGAVNGGGGGGGANGYRAGAGGRAGTDNPPPPPPPPPPVPPPPPEPTPPRPVPTPVRFGRRVNRVVPTPTPVRVGRRINRRVNRRSDRYIPPPPQRVPAPPDRRGRRSGRSRRRRRRRRRRGGGCFTEETMVLMRNPWVLSGSGKGAFYEKAISDVVIGDYVSSIDKTTANEVVFIEKHDKSMNWKLYSPDPDMKPFATINHMVKKDGEWVAVDNELYPWLDVCQKLEDTLVAELKGESVYNLWVTGDGTYNVNGYGTHSIMFDGGFMRNAYDQRVITYKDVLNLMKEFTVKKKEVLHGAFLVNKIFGKVNFPIANKLFAYILLADDETLRKKLVLVLMKVLTKIGGLLK